jgi:hypothetical protein
MRRAYIALSLVLAPAAACIDSEEPDEVPVVRTGDFHHFMQTAWVVPTTWQEVRGQGFDFLDNGGVQNAIGHVLEQLDGFGLDLALANIEGFGNGDVVVLHSVRADSLDTDTSVSWRVLNGVTPTPPTFDGTDAFLVTSDEGILFGDITGGTLTAGHGTATVRLPYFPGQRALELPLVDARVEMSLDGTCHGKIGGLVPADMLDSMVLPQLGAQAVEHMARHPEHEFTAIAIRVFDDNGDGVVTAQEVADGRLTRSFFTPDIDRDHDLGEKDAISFGLAFDCVPATFTVASE